MAYPIHSKEELFDYCRRRLGEPTLQINVTDDQIEDCFQETLSFWQIYHTDGSEKVYIKHKLTATSITIADATNWLAEDDIIGLDSLEAPIDLITSVRSKLGNVLSINKQTGVAQGSLRLAVGQKIKNKRTNEIATITALTSGDMDNGYVTVDDNIYGVQRVFPYSLGQGQTGAASLFNLQYQLRLHELGSLANVSLQYFVQTMTNIRMLDQILNGAPLIRFNRFQNRVVLDAFWNSTLNVDNWILLEAYALMDPNVWTRAYGDPWIVKHLTACIKKQFGTNLKKFGGILLVGGVSLDGQGMYDEAVGEMKELEDDLVNNGAPLEFYCG